MTKHAQFTRRLGLTGLAWKREGHWACPLRHMFGLDVKACLQIGAFSSLTYPVLLNSCLLPTAVKVWGMAYFGR